MCECVFVCVCVYLFLCVVVKELVFCNYFVIFKKI